MLCIAGVFCCKASGVSLGVSFYPVSPLELPLRFSWNESLLPGVSVAPLVVEARCRGSELGRRLAHKRRLLRCHGEHREPAESDHQRRQHTDGSDDA